MQTIPYDVTPLVASSSECDYCQDGDLTEQHYHELYVSRDGASSRTADDLAVQIIEDAGDLLDDSELRAWAEDWWQQIIHEGDMGCHWLSEEDSEKGAADELEDCRGRAEDRLADAGYSVSWDDGYVIERVVERVNDGRDGVYDRT